MIIPAYNEDDILRELLDDYKSVQRKAKKICQRWLIPIFRLTLYNFKAMKKKKYESQLQLLKVMWEKT